MATGKYHGNMDDKKWEKHRKYGDEGSKYAQSHAAEEGWKDAEAGDPNAFYERNKNSN